MSCPSEAFVPVDRSPADPDPENSNGSSPRRPASAGGRALRSESANDPHSGPHVLQLPGARSSDLRVREGDDLERLAVRQVLEREAAERGNCSQFRLRRFRCPSPTRNGTAATDGNAFGIDRPPCAGSSGSRFGFRLASTHKPNIPHTNPRTATVLGWLAPHPRAFERGWICEAALGQSRRPHRQITRGVPSGLPFVAAPGAAETELLQRR